MKDTLSDTIWKIVIITIITIFLFFFFYIFFNATPENISFYGQFGDSFGVLNSLFSGLGFCGLIITIFVQQKQLKQQSVENKKRETESASLFNLDSILQAYEEAKLLLIDGNNDRSTWIRAGRLVSHAKSLEINLIEIHKIRLETKQLHIRPFFSELIQNKPSHFFYGVPEKYAGNIQMAAHMSAGPYPIHNKKHENFAYVIPETSIKAIWEAGQWPAEYSDPLGNKFTENEMENLIISYRNIHEYFIHFQDSKKKWIERKKQE